MTSQVDRIQIHAMPPAAPGHCALCGTTQGPVIDFGMNMEFFGVIYFCVENCLVNIANAFDYHSPRQWKMLMNQMENQRQEINELRDENEQLRTSIDSLAGLSIISSIDSTPEFDVDKVLEEPEPEPDRNPDQLAFDFSAGEDGLTEQNDERGPTSIHYDDNELEKFFDSI